MAESGVPSGTRKLPVKYLVLLPFASQKCERLLPTSTWRLGKRSSGLTPVLVVRGIVALSSLGALLVASKYSSKLPIVVLSDMFMSPTLGV
jgi:hypothetical protein